MLRPLQDLPFSNRKFHIIYIYGNHVGPSSSFYHARGLEFSCLGIAAANLVSSDSLGLKVQGLGGSC